MLNFTEPSDATGYEIKFLCMIRLNWFDTCRGKHWFDYLYSSCSFLNYFQYLKAFSFVTGGADSKIFI